MKKGFFAFSDNLLFEKPKQVGRFYFLGSYPARVDKLPPHPPPLRSNGGFKVIQPKENS
jgi:hypothetical protein